MKGGVPFCEVCVGSVVICRAPFFCSGPLSSPLLSGGERKRGFLFIGLCTRYKAKTEAEEWEKGAEAEIKLGVVPSFLSRDITFDTVWPNREFPQILGRRLNGFLGLSLNDGTILFLVILLDKTVSVG